jgi:sugar lactone lactonase YvrE
LSVLKSWAGRVDSGLVRTGRAGRHWAAAVVVASCLATVVGAVPSPPARAATGDISTFAGSLGEGPATRIAQMSVAPAVHGRTLYLSEGPLVRAVDLDSGLERIVAGTGQWGSTGDGGPATAATLNASSITVDGAGNVLVVDDSRIRRIDTTGRITAVAGGGTRRDEGAPALETDLGSPAGIALDAAGAVYYSDTWSKKVRRIGTNGVVTTVAGVGPKTSPVFSGDGGPAVLADLYGPGDVTFDPAGRLHFIDGPRVRRVDAQGIIATVAGGGTYPWGANGVRATDVQLSAWGLVFDGAGDLYIAESAWIRRVDAGGRITTIAGNGLTTIRRDHTEVDPGDGEPATGVALVPLRLALDGGGNLYVTEWGRGRVRRIAPSGIITTVAGNGTRGLGGDGGPAHQAQLLHPGATASDRAGNLYIADTDNGRIRKVSPSGIITSLAQRFESPSALAIDGAGRLYVKTRGEVVLRVDPDGLVTRWAGGGTGDIADGGPATSGWVRVAGLDVDRAGNLFIIDSGRIRRVDLAGIITTVAGGGFATAEEGLPARSASLYPSAVAVDSTGSVLLTDVATQRIWQVTSGGRLTNVAGTTRGFSGDGGPATAAQLNLGIPYYLASSGLAVDPADQIFVLDFLNFRVRRIDTAGTITTVAGNGVGWDFATERPPATGEGVPATSTPIATTDIGFDRSGNLYLVDPYASRIRTVPGVGLAAAPATPAAVMVRAGGTTAVTGATTTSTTALVAPSAPAATTPAPATTAPVPVATPSPIEPAPAPDATVARAAAITASGRRSLEGRSPTIDPGLWPPLAAAGALAASATSSVWLWRRRSRFG